MHEWPLLIFSYLLQIAMGGALGLWITLKLLKKNEQESFQIAKLPMILLSVFALVGLAASFLHLGKASNVFNVIMNLGDSWFSREILSVGLFIAALVCTTILTLVTKKINQALLLVTAIVGFIAVPVMSMLYATTIIEAWNGFGTFAIFYGTYFMAGAIVVAIFIKDINISAYYGLIAIAVLGLIVKLVVLPTHYAGLTEVLTSTQQTLLYTSLALSAVGVVVMGYVVLVKKSYNVAFFGIACMLILVGEFLARYEFFTHSI